MNFRTEDACYFYDDEIYIPSVNEHTEPIDPYDYYDDEIYIPSDKRKKRQEKRRDGDLTVTYSGHGDEGWSLSGGGDGGMYAVSTMIGVLLGILIGWLLKR